MESPRPERVLGAIVAVLVVVAIVAIAFSLGRDSTTFEADSPEGVVQSYLGAVVDGDYDAAIGYLEPDSECDASDLDRTFVPRGVAIELLEVVTEGERSRVRIEIDYSPDDPFASDSGEDRVLRLRQTPDGWRLTGIPWPLFDCDPPTP